MGRCVVRGCPSRTNLHYKDGIRFYGLPTVMKHSHLHSQRRHQRRRTFWLTQMNRMDLMHKETKVIVCSRHFKTGRPAAVINEAHCDWGPHLRLRPNDALDERDVVVNAETELDLPAGNQPGGSHHENQVRVETADSGQAVAQSDSGVPSNSENDDPLECRSSKNSEHDSELGEHLCPESNVVKNTDCDDVQEEIDVLHNLQSEHACAEGHVVEALHCNDIGSDCVNDLPLDNVSINQRIVNNSAVLSDKMSVEYEKLQADYNELVELHVELRDQLAEVQLDKFEISQAISAVNENIERYSRKCEFLEFESENHKGKEEAMEATIKSLQEHAIAAERRISHLEMQLRDAKKCMFSLEQLQNDNSLVNYYTGLPSFGIFTTVLTLVPDHIMDKTCSLRPWQGLLLTLMRLRLGLQLEDLGHRFGIALSTAGFIFEKWLYYLFVYLEPCINWPDRETLRKTIPNSFKDAFGNSGAVIFDCLELFCETAHGLDSRKFLIGITPLGAISFLSQGWGGGVSDNHIIAHSGLYEKLLPNDVILADKRFTTAEDAGFYCARLLTPAFSHDQAQQRTRDISGARNLASLRVHIDTLTALVKGRYPILKTTLDHDFLTVKPGHKVAQIDEMVRVCSALSNLSSSPVIQI